MMEKYIVPVCLLIATTGSAQLPPNVQFNYHMWLSKLSIYRDEIYLGR